MDPKELRGKYADLPAITRCRYCTELHAADNPCEAVKTISGLTGLLKEARAKHRSGKYWPLELVERIDVFLESLPPNK
jgi:hypothetical protein